MRYFTVIILNLAILQPMFIGLTIAGSSVCENVPCEQYCPYGNLHEEGCRTCTCNDPCKFEECPPGEECKVESMMCIWQPCGYMGKCVPACPVHDCRSNCPYGFAVNEKGCETCQCRDHCKNMICAPGEICTVEYVTNFAAGGVRTKCTKKCNDLPCHANTVCEYGFERDCDGCPTCACKNPCEGVTCPKGSYCFVENVQCVTDPCPSPSASCQSYCPPNSWPLIGLYDYAVQCTAGAWNCPIGYDCIHVPNLSESYCCTTPHNH
ncbi:antistasin-like isoform X1 [Photinus pyralis]|uniref:antistasin-like isoform X1 n=1 Tax=Photinus pyralis TaxID=7054 RepID=UPI001267689C|nr:antistasin-like isoform X1 [Photinus pyralis]